MHLSSQIKSTSGRIILAPMEGVLDSLLREILTAVNHYDLCVTEFVRVVDQLLTRKALYRLCPELLQGGKTTSGTPVRVQLLGQHPQWLAENSILATELGSPGIDINFGCPARRVNNSCGGAALLKDPESIYQILRTVRDALPAEQLLSAKVRLGWSSPDECHEIIDAVLQGGAGELAIHARTKEDGYKAETIKWEWINTVRPKINIPLIANGEIWNVEDAANCRQITGCEDIMVGRGALQLPNLGAVIARNHRAMAWSNVLDLLIQYADAALALPRSDYVPSRLKQWLVYLKQQYTEAAELFTSIRTEHDTEKFIDRLRAEKTKRA
jgi:tRNA-dihydrouridine synthase C